ncbi:MAG: hypothetical protein AAB801_03360, partial [Patescibacteria group bacterium]
EFQGIPEDPQSYQAFLEGLGGHTRPLPSESDSKPEFYRDYYLMEAKAESVRRERASEDAYKLGLRLWLLHEGIEEANVSMIRDSRALRALRAGLEGRLLREYEPRPDTKEADKPFSLFEEFKMIKDFKKPTMEDFAFMNAQAAYIIGKKVREQRLAKEKARSLQRSQIK